jgi:hypothetical protein
VPDDLPRENGGKNDGKDDGKAIIGDPRDYENLITSQLHLAFRKFHNALVGHVRKKGIPPDKVFAEAQRLCRWHYQWMVLHDFLPRIVGQDVVNGILQERGNAPAKVKLDFYKPKNPNRPMMPVEFAVAAYRFGHSMIPKEYVLNERTEEPVVLFGGPKNLNGGRALTREFEIDWQYFFDIPDPHIPGGSRPVKGRFARKIDSVLSDPLFHLPPNFAPHVSLAERNLLRGKMLGLASGQRVAQEMGAKEVLSNAKLGLGNDPGWEGQAPLWFYILKEAEIQCEGKQLGTVGGRIVAEVFVGLLVRDKSSYLSVDPAFRPLPPPVARESGEFGMGDLLKFAGVA